MKTRFAHSSLHPNRGLLFVALLLVAAWAMAQDATSVKPKLNTGAEIYQAACVACHGPDGKGMPDTTVGFQKPKTFPDFTQCSQTTPELDKDWKATVRDGGAGRGLSRIMPAFGDALNSKQRDQVVQYLRGFCTDKIWPRGEFNLPLPQFTEKAFPENEVIITSRVNAQGTPGVTNDIISENTFGARNQLEIDAPIDFSRSAPGLWHGGVGDATIGLKRVVFANLRTGSILSGFGGIIVPSGSTTHGLGTGTTQFETFAAFAQLLPRESFVQLQAGTDQPIDTLKAPRSLFWRSAFGKTFRQSNGVGRMWTPMMEVVANKDFLPQTTPDWDIVPQFQVTLSQRQHVRVNIGTRIPVTNTSNRPIQVVFYVLWDWFDGSLLKGWK
ncbi:MAG: cytochrome c, class [Bryobacterales bacterium]|nr:cytochrome c, class [Bryobacterales bacterium]